ncbi:DUF6895 family protein [Streptomyces sp. G35A]
MTAPGTGDVRQVAEDALAWVTAHRAGFSLGEDALAVDGEVDRSWKPLGELAQVCATVTHHTDASDPLHARARALLDFAWRETDGGELFLRLQRLEPFATYPLEVYAALASAGFRHPGYEDAAAVVAGTRGWRLVEQEPTRRLAVLCAEERSGIHRPGPAPRPLPRTWLGGLPEPWTFGRDSGYALTHVVYHLTDWGRDEAGLPPGLAAYLADWLPPWLDTCLEARMWDLGCELLAVAAILARLTGGRAPEDAWQQVRAARRPSGEVPLQHRDPAPADPAGTGAPDDGQYFLHHYHSTLMAAFAAVLTTARPDGARHRHGGQGVPA